MGKLLSEHFNNDERFEGILFFSDDEYDEAYIGYTSDRRAVYDYELMLQGLIKSGMTEEDAADYISYNTLRSLPYMGDEAPIVLFRDYEWLAEHEIIEAESRCDYCKGKDTEQCGICENYSEWHR